MLSSLNLSSREQRAIFLDRLVLQPAVLVRIASTVGSVPREAGTWMGVFTDEVVGTIGGGHLEHEAIAAARDYLRIHQRSDTQSDMPMRLRFALGPALGQCCGGVVNLAPECVTASDASALVARLDEVVTPVALFGGGHVGHALVRVLAGLPFSVTWIDSRDGIFPADVPSGVVCEHSEPVHLAVRKLAPQSRVLIMSFSHAEDLDVLAACLLRQRERADLPYLGLIGSKTKWATFQHRLQSRGFTEAEMAHVTSPIGVPGIAGKEPAVIAVAVAAQLLQTTGA